MSEGVVVDCQNCAACKYKAANVKHEALKTDLAHRICEEAKGQPMGVVLKICLAGLEECDIARAELFAYRALAIEEYLRELAEDGDAKLGKIPEQ